MLLDLKGKNILMMKQIREFYFDSTVRDSKYLIAGIRAKSNQKRPKIQLPPKAHIITKCLVKPGPVIVCGGL